MIYQPETNDQVDKWRRRAALPIDHPEAMTLAELREAVAHLRGERKDAAAQGAAKKAKASKEPVDVKKLLEGW